MSTDAAPRPASDEVPASAVDRRRFLLRAGSAGLLGFAAPLLAGDPASAAPAGAADGTPEQVHLTWGADPATSVVVSWASAAQASNPRVRVSDGTGAARTVAAVQRTYSDGLNGETVFCYHAELAGLAPATSCAYTVLADNSSATAPYAARFTTAPVGRTAFRFTSFGDLATPNAQWVLSYGQAAYAVGAVETFAPLFHLLNGDLCYANLNPKTQPAVWRDFGNNNQASAGNRPWMPCPGNHEIELDNGPQGFTSYLTRYALPANGTAFPGRWYSFRVGSAVFISLSADDVCYQDGGAFVGGTADLQPAPSTGNATIPAGTAFYIHGYSAGAQTAWLEGTLAAARADTSVDWIVVQMHQDALTSSQAGNGSDAGIRAEWLPLFDRYSVDLVVCGHDHDYERSHPVRGTDRLAGRDAITGAAVETFRPHPVTTSDARVIDTSTGTVHLILGGGGTSAPLEKYGVDSADGVRQAKVFTRRNAPLQNGSGAWSKPGPDAVEDAVWSAQTDPETGYGLAVFDLEPGTAAGGQTSITVSYYHATGADPKNPNTGATGRRTPTTRCWRRSPWCAAAATVPRPRCSRSSGVPRWRWVGRRSPAQLCCTCAPATASQGSSDYRSTLTARASTRPMVDRATRLCTVMRALAPRDSGSVSVGEKATTLV